MFLEAIRWLFSSARLLVACSLFLSLAYDAPGATRTWDGGGTDNNWTTATNWVGDVAPIAGDDLAFPEGAARLSAVNNFPASTPFNSIAIRGSGYTLSGATLVLGGGISATHTSGVSRVGFPIQLSANQTFSNSTNGSLYFTGTTIDLNGRNLTFDGTAGEIQVISAAIVGAGDVIKTGAGYLGLVPGSSYTGATEVRQGRVAVHSGSALGGPASGTTVFPGATLNPGGTFTSAEPLVLHGALNIGGFQFGTNVWTGPITLMATNVSILVNGSARGPRRFHQEWRRHPHPERQ
jgi:fibronectin-binding autotransporter adhesin